MNFLNNKGQESAPFELLIAVILMSFVIVIGLYSLDVLQEEKCEGLVNQKLENLKEALETVAQGKGQYNIGFILPACGSNTQVRIVDETDPFICSNFCGGGRSFCTLLQFKGDDVSPITKCVNISPLTEFGSQQQGPCPNRESENLILEDWDTLEKIPEGNYILVSAYTISPSANPVICAYRRVN